MIQKIKFIHSFTIPPSRVIQYLQIETQGKLTMSERKSGTSQEHNPCFQKTTLWCSTVPYASDLPQPAKVLKKRVKLEFTWI